MRTALFGRLSVITALCISSAVAFGESEQRLYIYDATAQTPPTAKAADEQVRLTRLQSGAFGKPDDFSAAAHVSFQAERRTVAVDSIPLRITPKALPDGWYNAGRAYVWNKMQRPRGEARFMEFGLDAGALSEFQQLWVDYTPAPGTAACTPQVELQFAPRAALPTRLLAPRDETELIPLFDVNAGAASWKPKDLSYLARRALAMPPDEDWRYSQDRDNAVFQRRLDLPLSNVDVLEVVTAPGAPLKQINIKVAASPGWTSELLEVPRAGLLTSAGNDRFRVDLRALIAQRLSASGNGNVDSKRGFRLKEVFIFMGGEATALASARVLRNMRFLGQAGPSHSATAELAAARFQQINRLQWRMAVDLRGINEKGLFTQAASLRLVPPQNATLCAVAIDRIEAVTTYGGALLPLFARRVEDWSRRWGGPFRVVAPRDGEVEDPGIVGYLPFSAFTLADSVKDQTIESSFGQPVRRIRPPHVRKRSPLEQDGRSDLVDDPKPRLALIASSGATLSIDGSLTKSAVDGDGLTLEGVSKAMELVWPLTARVSSHAIFFFGVDHGSDQIQSITLTIESAHGHASRTIVPNQPVQLGDVGTELRRIRLRIVPSNGSFRYKFREIALFEPRSASYWDAFAVRLPMPFRLEPKVVLRSAEAVAPRIHSLPGHISGFIVQDGNPIRFSTALTPALDLVRGIHFKYRSGALAGGCFVTLHLKWARRTTEAKLCAEKPDQMTFIPVSRLFGAAPAEVGALESIDWALSPEIQSANAQATFFDLEFAIEGIGMASASDDVDRAGVFDFATLSTDKAIPVGSQKEWLRVAVQAKNAMITGATLQPLTQPFLTFDQVVVTPDKLLSAERWIALTERAPSQQRPTLWLSINALAAIALVMGSLLARRVWTLATTRWPALARPAMCLSKLRPAVQAVPGATWIYRKPRETVAVIVVAICVWASGWEGATFAGLMLATTSLLLSVGLYCGWRRNFAVMSSPPAEAVVKAVALATVAAFPLWALGHYGLSAAALWALLPIAAAGYLIYTPLPPGSRRVVCLIAYFLACLGIAATLYAMGSKYAGGPHENYFFTFGALAAAFAWHAALLLSRASIRRFVPAVERLAYGSPHSEFLFAAMLALSAFIVSLLTQRSFAVDQFALMVYFLLALGVVTAVVSALIRRAKP